MKMFPALAALTLAVSPAALNAQVQQVMHVDASAPLVTLTVQEEVQSAPTLATLSAGVTTQAATASDALRQNAQKMNAVVAELKKRGIAAKDIQTSGINLNPQYNYNNNGENQPPRLTGYQASNNVTIKTRDLAKIGELLDALVAVGGNNISGPNFSIEDDSKLKFAARDKALQSAQAQANFYAQRSGYKSAKLVSITEGVTINHGPMPVMLESRAAGKADFSPVEPGEVGTGVTLTIQYRLEN